MKVSIAVMVLLSSAAAIGCGGSSQGGLTNVPAPSHVEQAGTEQHDVISNGPESCPPTGTEGDPVPHRAAKCPEQPKKGSTPR